MTSISSTTAYQSPLARLQSTLQSDISTGSIKSSDQSALATALENIDGTLSSNRSSATSSSKPPSRDEMKGKIADLIQQQVSAGTLTSDQATELAQVFDDTFSKGKGTQSAGGPQGAGGPPPGPPPEEGQSTEATDDSSSSSTSITDILKQLQDALTESSQTSYSANGTSSSSSSTSYLFDLVA
ncbi:hypothetical protein [Pleomorphomonas oryzae]|uniref:hypothetical protein n=1 Tax=Pleomorphomonas oryzae TaxID=261934 RepID=UPI0004222470|nr:hypothetical protein [Pleomorphomonas oryzae]